MPSLLLRLAAPLQSYGTQSVFNVRDTGLEPSKSAVVGLIANALGRNREADLTDLNALSMGVRIDRPGVMEVDFQTAQNVPKSNGSRGNVVSWRYYLSDAEFMVALEGEEALLREIDDALEYPAHPIFLGRKGFLPSLPVRGGWTEKDIRGALQSAPWRARSAREEKQMKRKAEKGEMRLSAVLDAPYGSTPDVRMDVPHCFAEGRRTYSARYVSHEMLSLAPEHILEDVLCISHA